MNVQYEEFFYKTLPTTKWGKYFDIYVFHSHTVTDGMVSCESGLADINGTLQARSAYALAPYFILSVVLLTFFSIMMMLQWQHEGGKRINWMKSKVRTIPLRSSRINRLSAASGIAGRGDSNDGHCVWYGLDALVRHAI